MITSNNARKVLKHLELLDIELEGDDLLLLEMAALQFYPNHIIGVVDRVLSGGNVVSKITKAIDQGWSYFEEPVYSMLSGRISAHTHIDYDIDNFDIDKVRYCWRLICGNFLAHDINIHEMAMVLVDIPGMVRSKKDVIEGIRAAKKQQVRSVAYLEAIIRRTAEVKKILAYEETKSAEVWTPDESVRVQDMESARERWKVISNILQMKGTE